MFKLLLVIALFALVALSQLKSPPHPDEYSVKITNDETQKNFKVYVAKAEPPKTRFRADALASNFTMILYGDRKITFLYTQVAPGQYSCFTSDTINSTSFDFLQSLSTIYTEYAGQGQSKTTDEPCDIWRNPQNSDTFYVNVNAAAPVELQDYKTQEIMASFDDYRVGECSVPDSVFELPFPESECTSNNARVRSILAFADFPLFKAH